MIKKFSPGSLVVTSKSFCVWKIHPDEGYESLGRLNRQDVLVLLDVCENSIVGNRHHYRVLTKLGIGWVFVIHGHSFTYL